MSWKSYWLGFFIATVAYICAAVPAQYKYDKQNKELEQLKSSQVIVYQADNYGSSIVGTVDSKGTLNGTYYVTVDGYNWQINHTAWLQVKVGDRVVGQMKEGKE